MVKKKKVKLSKDFKINFHPDFWKSYDRLFSWKPWYSVPRFFSDAKYEIKWAWQRVFRGYDDRITWDIDSYLSEYLPKIIRQMAKNLNGHPSNIFESPEKRKKAEVHDIKSWKAVLEKIAVGFEAADRILKGEYMIDSKEKYTEGFFKGQYKRIVDKKIYKDLEKKFDVGMEYFKKYFFNLWD